NLALDTLRRRRRRAALGADLEAIADPRPDALQRLALRGQVGELFAAAAAALGTERVAMCRRLLDGYSGREVAEEFGRPRRAIYHATAAVRRHLRRTAAP